MNQLLLISHGGFASGARQATELILGAQSNLHVVELDGEKGIAVFKQELLDKITILSAAESKIIILSDLKVVRHITPQWRLLSLTTYGIISPCSLG